MYIYELTINLISVRSSSLAMRLIFVDTDIKMLVVLTIKCRYIFSHTHMYITEKKIVLIWDFSHIEVLDPLVKYIIVFSSKTCWWK